MSTTAFGIANLGLPKTLGNVRQLAQSLRAQGSRDVATLGEALQDQIDQLIAALNPDVPVSVSVPPIPPGSITAEDFAASIRPVQIVSSLPTLPDPLFPNGSVVFLTSDGQLYRNKSGTWTAEVPTINLTGLIQTGQLAANSVTAGKLAANSVTAGAIAAGAISASIIVAGTMAADRIGAGTMSLGGGGLTITGGNIIFGGSVMSFSSSSSSLQIAGGSGASSVIIANGALSIYTDGAGSAAFLKLNAGTAGTPSGNDITMLSDLGIFLSGTTRYYYGGVQVVGPRQTGWTQPTGTATRTGYATSTATATQVAEALKALIADLATHGLIG